MIVITREAGQGEKVIYGCFAFEGISGEARIIYRDTPHNRQEEA